ncbi:hypothetical protein EYF80_006095 [Liparis tanakae]|uniref:Uncharacterized protein n=1 Tax=Liparis tanakae TaxID=230148 RepID=A0A4Z2J0M3_9TELE|nr:hypothetical protein EYF80_006095 [Liparis tanakae]
MWSTEDELHNYKFQNSSKQTHLCPSFRHIHTNRAVPELFILGFPAPATDFNTATSIVACGSFPGSSRRRRPETARDTAPGLKIAGTLRRENTPSGLAVVGSWDQKRGHKEGVAYVHSGPANHRTFSLTIGKPLRAWGLYIWEPRDYGGVSAALCSAHLGLTSFE